jgi:hypothetical protein
MVSLLIFDEKDVPKTIAKYCYFLLFILVRLLYLLKQLNDQLQVLG